METTEIVKGKKIYVRLDDNYHFGGGFRNYVEWGLEQGKTRGYFKSKAGKHPVGIWRLEEEKKGWLYYFTKVFK